MLVYSVFTLDVCQSAINVLGPLLGWTDEDVMYLDMLWSSQDVHHRVCHVLGLQAVEGRRDCCRPCWVSRVHRPDVGAHVANLLPPALEEAGHRKLGGCIKPG